MATTTISFQVTCHARMKSFYKATRSAYKLQKEMLVLKRNGMPFYRFIAIYLTNNKIEKIESKISKLNDKIKKCKS